MAESYARGGLHARQLAMTRVSRGQHDSFLLRWAWSPSVTVLSGSIIHGGELVSIGEGHPYFRLGFNDSLMTWETSSAWQVGQQEDFRRSSCMRDFIRIVIELYLQGPVALKLPKFWGSGSTNFFNKDQITYEQSVCHSHPIFYIIYCK